jgi:hypothetical protein
MPPLMNNAGETLQERSKGKDVRLSNIVAAKVSEIRSILFYVLQAWYYDLTVALVPQGATSIDTFTEY